MPGVSDRRGARVMGTLAIVAALFLAGCGEDDETAAPGDTLPAPGSGEREPTTTGGGEGTTPATGAEETTPTTGGDGTTPTTGAEEATPVTDPSGPDLQLFTLPECSVVPGGALSGADALTMFVAVRNGGPGSVDRLVPVRIRSDTGLSATLNSAISTGSATTGMSVDLSGGDYERTHVFSIVADPGNEIIERDVTNNEIQVTVNLPSRPSRATDVPCTSP
jgi:hypothetical protein